MMQPNDSNLTRLFGEHPMLKDCFENDATVYAWLQQYRRERCTLEEALIGIIVHLAKEKKTYFDEVIELKMKEVRS